MNGIAKSSTVVTKADYATFDVNSPFILLPAYDYLEFLNSFKDAAPLDCDYNADPVTCNCTSIQSSSFPEIVISMGKNNDKYEFHISSENYIYLNPRSEKCELRFLQN